MVSKGPPPGWDVPGLLASCIFALPSALCPFRAPELWAGEFSQLSLVHWHITSCRAASRRGPPRPLRFPFCGWPQAITAPSIERFPTQLSLRLPADAAGA